METLVDHASKLPLMSVGYDEDNGVALRREWRYRDVKVVDDDDRFRVDYTDYRVEWSHYINDPDGLKGLDFPVYFVGDTMDSHPFVVVVKSKSWDRDGDRPASIASVGVIYDRQENGRSVGKPVLSIIQQMAGEAGCGAETNVHTRRGEVCISVYGEDAEVVQSALRELRPFQ
jgi:hypothetical protein